MPPETENNFSAETLAEEVPVEPPEKEPLELLENLLKEGHKRGKKAA